MTRGVQNVVVLQREARRALPIFCCRRRGFSLLEFEVALVLFGIALCGLFPLVVMQSRAVRALGRRLPNQSTWYLSPSPDAWVRKLGAAATLSTTPPAPLPPPPVLTVDNGDPGYVESGGWTTQTDSAAFQGSVRSHGPQLGNPDTASWQFSDVPPGWYQFAATWLPAADRSPNAAYKVTDGTTLLGTFTANQQGFPKGLLLDNQTWQILTTRWINGPDVVVVLSAQANGSVVADGLQLVPLQNDVQVLSLQRSSAPQQVTIEAQVNVLVPQ